MASINNYEEAFAKIEEHLICHLCERAPRPKKPQWYRCSSSHLICQDCLDSRMILLETQVLMCKCNCKISLQFCRLIEAVLNIQGKKFKCKNANLGCAQTFVEDALFSHEKECIFRLVPCPYPKWNKANDCDVQVTFKDVIPHYEQSTSQKLKSVPKNVVTGKYVKKITLPQNYAETGICACCQLEFEGKQFVSSVVFFKRSGLYHHWIHFLGTPTEANQYAFALEYKGPKIASTFVGEVVSIDEPWDSIVSNYKCFTTPFANFKAQFVNEANEYEYSLKIRNLKEEAKDDTIESGISDNDD